MKKLAQAVFAAVLVFSSVMPSTSHGGGYVIGKDRIFEEFQRLGQVIYDRILKGFLLPGVSLERLRELLKKMNILEVVVLPAGAGPSMVIQRVSEREFLGYVPADGSNQNNVVVYVDPERWENSSEDEKLEQVLLALIEQLPSAPQE